MPTPAQGPITIYPPKPVSAEISPPSGDHPDFKSRFKIILSVLIVSGIVIGFYPWMGKAWGALTQGGSAVTLDRVLDESFNLSLAGYLEGSQLRSVATSGAPLVVSSSGLVINLNADLLDGQHGSYYLDLSSLDGVSNAGGNIDLIAGANVTITSDDVSNSITIAAGSGGGGDADTLDTLDSLQFVRSDTGNINIARLPTGGNWDISSDLTVESTTLFVGATGGTYSTKVGIGTVTPEFKLDLTGDGGIIARGTYGSGLTLSTTGEGSRLIWYPRKAAFRAGYASGTGWNDANIGNLSVAFGWQNQASGTGSAVGGGSANTTSASYSTVSGGQNNYASGTYAAIGGGLLNIAQGQRAFIAGGSDNQAAGDYSWAGGKYMQLGFNAHRTFAWGYAASAVSIDVPDVFIIYSSNAGIGTIAPESKLQVTGGGLCVGSDANCNTDNNTEGVVYSSATAMTVYDVAENYPTKDPTLTYGEVVALDPDNAVFVKRATDSSSGVLLGVISENPAVHLGGFNGSQFESEKQVAVGLSGRIPVRVTIEGGTIIVGDPLTISSTPGVAKKATSSGRVIGYALENYSAVGVGSIQFFINPGWYDPGVAVDIDGDVAQVDSAGLSTKIAVEEIAAAVGLFEKITSAVLEIASAVIDNLKVKFLTVGDSTAPAGITIYDRATGESYCVAVESGVLTTEAGTCE